MKHLHFHIGRGGRFYNGGHLTFKGEADFAEIQRGRADDLLWIDEDENGNPLPKEQQQLRALCSGKLLAQGDEIYAETGRLDFDGEFDTDYVTTPDDLNEDEAQALFDYYFGEGANMVATYNSDPFEVDHEEFVGTMRHKAEYGLDGWRNPTPQWLGIDDDEAFAWSFYRSGFCPENSLFLAVKQ